MLTRLERVQPFALHLTSVPAAGISPAAQSGIEWYLAEGRKELRQLIYEFLRWLQSSSRRSQPAPAEAQRRFSFLRLRFNAVLSQFDIFSDALTQRSEHETGVWLSGLDAVAEDALALPGYYQAPPTVCYLDRGAGAAIRRARTRLPGGGENPVAIVRVPRERMVGSGIASSLGARSWASGSRIAGPGQFDAVCVSEYAAQSWNTQRLAILGALDLRDPGRFLVDRTGGCCFHTGIDGGSQSTTRLRLSDEPGRSSSHPLDSGQA